MGICEPAMLPALGGRDGDGKRGDGGDGDNGDGGSSGFGGGLHVPVTSQRPFAVHTSLGGHETRMRWADMGRCVHSSRATPSHVWQYSS